MMKKVYLLILLCLALIVYVVLTFNASKETVESAPAGREENVLNSVNSTNNEYQKLSLEMPESVLSKDICTSAIKNFKYREEARQGAQAELRNFINMLIEDETPDYILDFAALISNLGVTNLRKHKLIKSRKDGNRPSINWAEHSHIQRFQALLQTDIASIILAIQNNEIDVSASYITNNVNTSLLGNLIKKFNDIDVDDLSRLIELGLTPSYSDIVEATERAWSIQKISLLLDASNLDPTKVDKSRVSYSSFSQAALTSGSFPLIQFWHSKGSPLNADFVYRDAVYSFTQYQSLYSIAEQQAIAKMISSEALMITSAQKIYPYISDDFKPEILQAMITSSEDAFSVVDFKRAMSIVESMRVIAKSAIERKSIGVPLVELDQDCVKKIYWTAIPQLFVSDFSKTKSFPTIQKMTSSQIDAEIKLARENGLSPQDIETQLLDLGPLLGKQAVEQYRYKLLRESLAQRDATKAQKKMLEDIDEETVNLVKEIYNLTLQQKWSKAISLAENVNEHRQDVYQLILAELVDSSDVQSGILRTLLMKGAEYSVHAPYRLIRAENVEGMKTILKESPDFLLREKPEQPLVKAAVRKKNLEMLKVLLKAGAVVYSSQTELDALDVAISNYSLRSDNSELFITELLNHGAIVYQSHKVAIQNMKKADFTSYEYITNKHGILASD